MGRTAAVVRVAVVLPDSPDERGAGGSGPQPGGEPREDLRPQGDEDDVRGRRRRRRGEGRAEGDRRVLAQPEEVPAAGWPDPEGRVAARPAGVRQGAARARRGGRSGRAALLYVGPRVRGEVRRPWRRAG